MKLKLFSKSFDQTLASGRSCIVWQNVGLRQKPCETMISIPSPPQCKLETASSHAFWMKLLAKCLFSTTSYKTAYKAVPKRTLKLPPCDVPSFSPFSRLWAWLLVLYQQRWRFISDPDTLGCSLVPSCFRTVSGCEDTSPSTNGCCATSLSRAPAQPGSDSPLTVLTKADHCEKKSKKQRSCGGGAARWIRARPSDQSASRGSLQPAAPPCVRGRVEGRRGAIGASPRTGRAVRDPVCARPPAYHAACCVGRIRRTWRRRKREIPADLATWTSGVLAGGHRARAGVCTAPRRFSWRSGRAHLIRHGAEVLGAWERDLVTHGWRADGCFLRGGDGDGDLITQIRQATRDGSDDFPANSRPGRSYRAGWPIQAAGGPVRTTLEF